MCAKCSGGHMPDKLVPCDRCNKGWHRFCLAPSVEVPAEGDWICPDCRTEGQSIACRARTLPGMHAAHAGWL